MKGIDFVIRKTAAELNYPEDQVKIIVMMYWEAIYKKLLNPKGITITARHIGNFTISRFKLKNLIKKRIKKIRKVRESDKLSENQKAEMLIEEYDKLKRALVLRNEIAKEFCERFKQK